ncbi:MAG: Lrp/AsnC family transcriptional regulator [Desulfamplus sp.]|nr:Lrp/AsnC family transcriptional regulator [Desulfamplus sp.]MBF0411861.1 Lrp/AsnC family transcriptional regulator [Desulfamplus sp.]
MDDTDFKILKILQEKARVPNVDIARNIGMAPSAVLERIKKLESKGIISGYEVRLNPECFNQSMITFILIQVIAPTQIQKSAELLCQYEEIQEVHYIAGEDCILAKVRTSNGFELQTFINQKIASIENIKSTKSFIALSTYKESARFPLPDTFN